MSAKRRQEAIARFAVPLRAVVTPGNEVRTLRKAGNRERDGDDENDGDSEFVMDGTDNDSDNEFVDDLQFKKKKSKGKGRAPIQAFDPSEENPRVMLLSLKAVSADLEKDDV